MNLPKVRIVKKEKGGYIVTVDGVSLPYVSRISYENGVNQFPTVTIEMIAELYQDEQPLEPVTDYAPWRDIPGAEQ